MQNDCMRNLDAWAAWQGILLKELEESSLEVERAAKLAGRKQFVVGQHMTKDPQRPYRERA
jgi:hypothetical protein